ncbi:MAG: uroporphyrinogen-III C-methyltransferase [Thermoanaerobacteraceae bacterium]
MYGKVYLVGVGPGDIKLLTIWALEVIKTCDVIIYDRLINKEILKIAKEDAEFIDVGKFPGYHKVPQEHINEIIVEKAKKGKSVARVKGGDPFVFGRGAEEAEYLKASGVSFEIIPGITSAVAVLTYAGIPVTHRNYSSSFQVISGYNRNDNEDKIDWDAAAKYKGTLIFLMGAKNLGYISNKLIKYGKDPKTPSAVIMNGTTFQQKVITGVLENIEKKAREEIVNPAIIVFGDTVKLREKLKWFENRDLYGKRILITRSYKQSGYMKDTLNNVGAQVILCPTIKITPIIDNVINFLKEINNYEYIVFTSTNSVEVFKQAVKKAKIDLRKLKSSIVAIGSQTAKSLEDMYIYPEILPEKYTSYFLAESLKDLVKDKNIALLTSQIGGNIFIQTLKKYANIKKIISYLNEPNYEIKEVLRDELKKGIDFAVFTSSSTFEYMYEIIREDIKLLRNSKIAAIGPITAESIQKKGFKVDIMPNQYTSEDLVNEIIKDIKI